MKAKKDAQLSATPKIEARASHIPKVDLPAATVSRLPIYLRLLDELADQQVLSTSSEALAGRAGVTSAQLRKDLSYLGSYGTRGVGYVVTKLIDNIRQALGLTANWNTAIFGFGNLGRALAGYTGFAARGFNLTAIFDVTADLVGKTCDGVEVFHLDRLEEQLPKLDVSIAILTVPVDGAQELTDRLVQQGITSVLSFVPSVLQVPAGVEVRKIDLASELQILAFHEQHKLTLPN